MHLKPSFLMVVIPNILDLVRAYAILEMFHYDCLRPSAMLLESWTPCLRCCCDTDPYHRLFAIELQQLQLYGNSSSAGYCIKACLKLKTAMMYTQRTHQEPGPHGRRGVRIKLDVTLVVKSVYKTKYDQQ